MHSMDIPLVFDNIAQPGSPSGKDADAQKAADQMSEAFIAFARTRQPGAREDSGMEAVRAAGARDDGVRCEVRSSSTILAARSASCLRRCLTFSAARIELRGGERAEPAVWSVLGAGDGKLYFRAVSCPQVPVLLFELLARLLVRGIAADIVFAVDDLAAAFDGVRDDACIDRIADPTDARQPQRITASAPPQRRDGPNARTAAPASPSEWASPMRWV